MSIIITIFITAAILGLAVGNYYFPSKEGVVETYDGAYKLYKYNRILFIPIKMWENNVHFRGMNVIIHFGTYSDAYKYNSIEKADEYLTSNRREAAKIGNKATGIKREVFNTKQSNTSMGGGQDYSFLLEDIEKATGVEKRVLESVYNKLKK